MNLSRYYTTIEFKTLGLYLIYRDPCRHHRCVNWMAVFRINFHRIRIRIWIQAFWWFRIQAMFLMNLTKSSIKPSKLPKSLSPKKRTSSILTSVMSYFVSFSWIIFACLDPVPDPEPNWILRRKHPALQHLKCLNFFFLEIIFACLDPVPDPHPETKLNPNPIRIRIRNTDGMV